MTYLQIAGLSDHVHLRWSIAAARIFERVLIMPTSRRRKKRARPETKGDVVKLSPEGMGALEAQRETFKKKFGRDWGPSDPIFFDPDCDVPTPMSATKVQAEVLRALEKSGAPPEWAYAYKKTGLMGFGDKSRWPKARRREWDRAIEEYHFIQISRQDKPYPPGWNTEIPELLASPFGQEDFDKVKELIAAIAPIEARGMTLVGRIEFAAAVLASACSHAFDSAENIDETGEGPERYAVTEELVIRRAREIYAQDGA